MQAAIFALNLESFGSRTLGQILEQMISFVTIIGAHAVNVALKIAVFNEFGQGKLFKIGYCAGIKAQFGIKK